MDRATGFYFYLRRVGLAVVLGAIFGLLSPWASWGNNAVRLEYWHIYGGDFGKIHEALIAEFNATHSDVQVEYAYIGNPWTGWDKLELAVAAGTAPDVALIEDYWTAPLADSSAILELDRSIEGEGRAFKDDIYPLFWESVSYKGKIWAMPYAASDMVLYYNKDLFREAGLDPDAPPRTWEELVAMGESLTEDTDGDGRIDRWGLSFPLTAHTGVVYYWIPFLWQNGGKLFNDDHTRVLFAEPEGVGALQFWLDLIYKYKIMPLAPPTEGFVSGRVAMTLGSSARLNLIYMPQVKFALGVAPLPMNAEKATILGGKALAIFTRDERKQQAAWEFIRWMTDARRNLRWSTATGYIPLRLSVLRSREFQDYLRATPGAAVAVDQLLYARPRPVLRAYTEISRILGLALERALFGREDPQGALEGAARAAQQVLTP